MPSCGGSRCGHFAAITVALSAFIVRVLRGAGAISLATASLLRVRPRRRAADTSVARRILVAFSSARQRRRDGSVGRLVRRVWLALAACVLAATLLPLSARAAITEYPVPDPNGNPTAITDGPDGALWFTEGDKKDRPGHDHRHVPRILGAEHASCNRGRSRRSAVVHRN